MAGTFALLIPFMLIVVAKLEDVPTNRLDDIDANIIKELKLLEENDISTQEVLSEIVDIQRSLEQYDNKESDMTEGGTNNVREKRYVETFSKIAEDSSFVFQKNKNLIAEDSSFVFQKNKNLIADTLKLILERNRSN